MSARILMMDDKTTDAIAQLRTLALDAPELPVVHVLLASAYIPEHNFEQARREITWVQTNTPDAARVKLLLPAFNALAAAKPDSEDYWLRAASLQMALGQMDLARAALEKAAAVAPQSAVPGLVLTRLEIDTGNADVALRRASAQAERFPQNVAVLTAQADALGVAKQFAQSARIFEQLQSQAPSATLALALHRIRKAGDLANPNEPLERWLANNPHDVPVRGVYAEALRTANDPRALAQYEMLAADAPQNPIALNNLAWLYHVAGDKRALETSRRAWQAGSSLVAVTDTYGWLLVESGSLEEGTKLLATADAAGGVTQPEIRLHYAQALARQGQGARAQILLTQLMAEKPDQTIQEQAARILDSLGRSGAT